MKCVLITFTIIQTLVLRWVLNITSKFFPMFWKKKFFLLKNFYLKKTHIFKMVCLFSIFSKLFFFFFVNFLPCKKLKKILSSRFAKVPSAMTHYERIFVICANGKIKGQAMRKEFLRIIKASNGLAFERRHCTISMKRHLSVLYY